MGVSEEPSLSWAKGVPAPKDADGLEIPLDVDALYDKNGDRVAVFRWNYVRGRNNSWTFNILFEYPDVPHYPQDYHLSNPDSWERLEEDVNLGSSDYCERYRLEECDYNMRTHMLARAKKLAGVEEETRND